jgi:hypothetical protein
MSLVALRCLTPFPQGTHLNVNGRRYHFAFNEHHHAVAYVLEQDVSTILSIGAGYQAYNEDDAASADDDLFIEPGRVLKAKEVADTDGETTLVETTAAYLAPSNTQFSDTPKKHRAPAKGASKE